MNVSIDDDFARIGAKSYAINKINSVEVRVSEPYGIAGAVICALLALIGFVNFVQSFSRPEGVSIGGLVLAVIFAGLAYWQWTKSKIRNYQLFLMTSSSETQAIVSQDGSWVQDLREQIEAAMLHHSRRGSDR